MHVGQFVRGLGRFYVTEYVPTSERTSSSYPLLLTTGRILSQYNVGAQTRRTENVTWHDADRLEMHPADAEAAASRRGIGWVSAVALVPRCCRRMLRIVCRRAWSTRPSTSLSQVPTS